MKNIKSKLWTTLFLFFFLRSGYAQQAITASGGDASSSGGSLNYSLGQVVYTTNTAVSGSAAQGVQLPYEILTIDVEEAISNISVEVFPNPAVGFLTLQIDLEKLIFNSLNYQLFDAQGRFLESGSIIEHQTQINIAGLMPAAYSLNIICQNKIIKSFKIIKK